MQPSFFFINLQTPAIIYCVICSDNNSISYLAKLVNSGACIKCFLSSVEKHRLLFLLGLLHTGSANTLMQSGLSRTHVVAVVTAINRPVLPAVLSRKLTVTSETTAFKMLFIK